MKINLKLGLFSIFLLGLVVTGCKAHAPSGGEAPSKETVKWFNSGVWKNGLTLNTDKSLNIAEFERQYKANQTWWDKAFSFMKEQNLENLKPGRYPIDGENVYATVSEAAGKDFETTKWESHRRYNDIQYIIKGKEKIGVASLKNATVTKPYDATGDIANYTSEGEFHIASPGTFFIFFPQNLHRPSIKVNGDEMIKKLVVKVRTGM